MVTTKNLIKLGIRHHNTGDLSKAESIYQKILEAAPDHPIALHLSGLVAHQLGNNDLAIHLISKALTIKPDYADAYYNLGNALKFSGKLNEAVDNYLKALALKPNDAEAHNNLGNTFQKLLKLDEAVHSYHKALAIKPDYVEARFNLGNALKELLKLDDAVASYQAALAIKPDYADVHNNLGAVLKDLGKIPEAIASYQQALALKPDFAEAHYNLAITLNEQGDFSGAELGYKSAIALKPDYLDALASFGTMLMVIGRWDEALSMLKKKCKLERGETPIDLGTDTFYKISRAKIKHDIEQFHYLHSQGLGNGKFDTIATKYEQVEKSLRWPSSDGQLIKMSELDRKPIAKYYNRAIHISNALAPPGPVVNPDLDAAAISSQYQTNGPGMTYFDGLLTPEALHALRNFLLESTIWFDTRYSGGYLGAMLADGLACPLLFKIAEELRATFPSIIKAYRVSGIWAYKYDSHLTGINVHADCALINVNFWITPEVANCNPATGGLIVYDKEAPIDWDFESYNNDPAKIRDFLLEQESGTMVAPYAANRAVMFNSNLFHETDEFEFKPGYENRRINVTILYGVRGQ